MFVELSLSRTNQVGCMEEREREKISSSDNRQFQLLHQFELNQHRSMMSCIMCKNEMEGPEGVCPDCLISLPHPQHIKKEEEDPEAMEVWARELPIQQWEHEFLNDHLASEDAGEKQFEEKLFENDVAAQDDLDDPHQIFWSDEESNESGYQSPEDLDQQDSHSSFPAHTTNEAVFQFIWQGAESTADQLISQGIYPGISFHSG